MVMRDVQLPDGTQVPSLGQGSWRMGERPDRRTSEVAALRLGVELGMSLIDTTDGVLMLGAYNWAFVKPMRKLYYNLVITAVSVVVAVLIGGIEGLGLMGDQLGLTGWFWDGIGTLNDNFGGLGFAIVGVFVFAWIASLVIYRYTGLDDLEVAPAGHRSGTRGFPPVR